MKTLHPKYRPDIDGLRAIAVLSVVAFHAFPGRLPGGFIGVDIFFVISGFLITTIIFENLENKTFSFLDFYSRRIKRIFPALILVLASVTAFGWIALYAIEYKQLGAHIAAGATFASNFLLWSEGGYFDVSASSKPLLHLWSLGIEEQFYIVWPMLIWFAWKLNFNVITLIVSIMTISFGVNLLYIESEPTNAFYLPHSRVWELLIGSLIAALKIYQKELCEATGLKLNNAFKLLLLQHPKGDKSTLFLDSLSVLGAMSLAYGFFFIEKGVEFPGWWALLPTFSAVLMLCAGPDAFVNKYVLSSRIFIFFGLISYPLYLWHWPLLSFATILEGEMPSRFIRVIAVLIAILLAYVTFQLIEKRFRSHFHSGAKTACLVLTMILIGALGYCIYASDGYRFRPANVEKFSTAAEEWEFPGKMEWTKNGGLWSYKLLSNTSEQTLFIGDSNAEQWYSRVEELIISNPDNVNGAIFRTIGGCLALPNIDLVPKWKKICSPLATDAMQLAERVEGVTNVVISQLWDGHFMQGFARTSYGGVGSKEYNETLATFDKFVSDLRSLGKNVYIVLMIPYHPDYHPLSLADRSLTNFPNFLQVREYGESRERHEDKYRKIHTDLRNIALKYGANIIDPVDTLCSESKCLTLDADGFPMYKDGGHLRPGYTRHHALFIDQTMRP